MTCRVGITTDLEERKKEHESNYSTLKNWKECGSYPSREEAQKAEDKLAKKCNCQAHPGGRIQIIVEKNGTCIALNIKLPHSYLHF